MGYANKMVPGVSEHAEHESCHQVFKKKEVDTSAKNSIFGYFSKIVELNTDVLESSLWSVIDNCSLTIAL